MGRPPAACTACACAGDEVSRSRSPRDEADLLVITDNGFGKRTPLADYPRKGRGTMGVLTIRLTEARGELRGVMVVRPGQEVMFITQDGIATRTPVEGISRMGRNTQGVIVQRLRPGDRVASVALVADPSRAAPEDDPEDADGPRQSTASGDDGGAGRRRGPAAGDRARRGRGRRRGCGRRRGRRRVVAALAGPAPYAPGWPVAAWGVRVGVLALPGATVPAEATPRAARVRPEHPDELRRPGDARASGALVYDMQVGVLSSSRRPRSGHRRWPGARGGASRRCAGLLHPPPLAPTRADGRRPVPHGDGLAARRAARRGAAVVPARHAWLPGRAGARAAGREGLVDKISMSAFEGTYLDIALRDCGIQASRSSASPSRSGSSPPPGTPPTSATSRSWSRTPAAPETRPRARAPSRACASRVTR